MKGLRNASIVVRQFKYTNEVWRKILNDIELSTLCENQCVTSVLRINDPMIVGEMVYIPCEPFGSTIQSFFNIPSLSMENFSEITKSIIDAVGNVHAQGIVLKNVSSVNMVWCYDNKKLMAKILNLSEAEKLSEVQEDSFTNDKMEVGYVLLSAVLKAEDVQNLREFERNQKLSLDQRENFINEQLRSIGFIESFKKQSFVRLVAALIEGKELSIHDYLSYPFFWDETKYEDVIKISNSWTDKNSSVKNNEIMNKLNEKFKISNVNEWREIVTKDGINVTGNFEETGCELLRFIRNKVQLFFDF